MRTIDKALVMLVTVELTYLAITRVICAKPPKPNLLDALPFTRGHSQVFNLAGLGIVLIALWGITRLATRQEDDS